MKFQKLTAFFMGLAVLFLSFFMFSCTPNNYTTTYTAEETQKQLNYLLQTQKLDSKQRYTIINQIANSLLAAQDYQGVILLLTEWVEKNPDDMYNSYWLLMTAHAYLSLGAEPVAEYYFDRILANCPDLLVKGNSIHFTCLQNLIQISKTPSHRIKYFNELINKFPQNVNTTELYLRLALEYENDNQWDQALKACELFLQQPDATTIQIPGEPDAYKNARHLIDFNNSSKDWTFETLDELVNAVKKAISNRDWRALDRYKAKVNFFSMSWRQDETAANSQEEFSMGNWMIRKAHYADTLDESSNANEAYLKTWGWNTYISTWYLYFRKVNFPLDPDINGNWEWAGIYLGNKL
ncbi:MAG: tetratricopeptide repeat protein [Treponema sp.]|nr:tetratricopeptide repeat protein [Treponema sp.]